MKRTVIKANLDAITLFDASSPDKDAAKFIIGQAKEGDCLVEISRERYGGGDGLAINKHSVRVYVGPSGFTYRLGRVLDCNPPYFESYGPTPIGFTGILKKMEMHDRDLWVGGKDLWGDGWNWNRAIKVFLDNVAETELLLALGCKPEGSAKAKNS